ncbi:hypothetical protein FB550_10233 [Neobacillus bataviensis]|uniref:Uncharacterized protein n=1 Tax=Neobacillus bataviensis TaxID=220685 RepID=A0A561DRN7_9BACI|nr:hypothetical protein FB550_10233 [Neobacillus bataviensis]
MFQLLIDLSDINALNALYVSIFLGITIKFLWAWSVEYTFLGSLSESANTKINYPHVFYRNQISINGSFILKRIVKYIRRKECSQDDSEEPISSLII